VFRTKIQSLEGLKDRTKTQTVQEEENLQCEEITIPECQWLTPIIILIPATWEAEIRRTVL
jgi:hypothetical protein